MFPISEKEEWTQKYNIPEEFFGHCNNIEKYEEPHYHYSSIPLKDNIDLIGYLQSERYFSEYSGEISNMLTPNELGDNGEYTAIHVRRTDYLQHVGCYTLLDMNYYEKAMEECQSSKYLIFSDDISWCKERFVGHQFEFSEERDPTKDLGNMITCSNFIIANSSYSWWGAWLCDNMQKKIIAPKLWFGPKLAPTHDTKDLIPLDWIKI